MDSTDSSEVEGARSRFRPQWPRTREKSEICRNSEEVDWTLSFCSGGRGGASGWSGQPRAQVWAAPTAGGTSGGWSDTKAGRAAMQVSVVGQGLNFWIGRSLFLWEFSGGEVSMNAAQIDLFNEKSATGHSQKCVF